MTLTIIYEGNRTIAPYVEPPGVMDDILRHMSFVELSPTEADRIFSAEGAHEKYKKSVPSMYWLNGQEYPNTQGATLSEFVEWEKSLNDKTSYNGENNP